MAASAESRTKQVRAATVGTLGPGHVVPHRPAHQLHRDLVEGSLGSRKEARFLSIKLGCEGTESPVKGPTGWLSVCVSVSVCVCVCVFRFQELKLKPAFLLWIKGSRI